MRFMMLMIPKGYENVPSDAKPASEKIEKMMRYNETLKAAGVLLALDGLHPPATGVRPSFVGGEPTVIRGPFPETTETLGGYWMIEVESRKAAIEWARRCPVSNGEIIEIRQVQEMLDFEPEAAERYTELRSQLPDASG